MWCHHKVLCIICIISLLQIDHFEQTIPCLGDQLSQSVRQIWSTKPHTHLLPKSITFVILYSRMSHLLHVIHLQPTAFGNTKIACRDSGKNITLICWDPLLSDGRLMFNYLFIYIIFTSFSFNWLAILNLFGMYSRHCVDSVSLMTTYVFAMRFNSFVPGRFEWNLRK